MPSPSFFEWAVRRTPRTSSLLVGAGAWLSQINGKREWALGPRAPGVPSPITGPVSRSANARMQWARSVALWPTMPFSACCRDAVYRLLVLASSSNRYPGGNEPPSAEGSPAASASGPAVTIRSRSWGGRCPRKSTGEEIFTCGWEEIFTSGWLRS